MYQISDRVKYSEILDEENISKFLNLFINFIANFIQILNLRPGGSREVLVRGRGHISWGDISGHQFL